MVGHEKRKITVCVRRAQTKVQKYNMLLSPLSFVLCPCWNEVLFPVSLSPAVILYSRDIAIVIRIAYHSIGRNIVEWVWVKWMFDKEFLAFSNECRGAIENYVKIAM